MKSARRKQTSVASALRPFWFLIALIALAGIFGVFWAATWPGLFPKQVTVAGNRSVQTQEILSRAHVANNVNLWLQNMGAAADRVETIPYVKEAQFHRSLPANLRINITERAPYAVLRYGKQTALVDRDLRVLQQAEGQVPFPQFILKARPMPAAGAFVHDAAVERLRDDYDTLAQAHVVVRSLGYDKFGDLVAGMTGGVRLLLGGEADLEKKAALIGPILSQVSASGRRIAAVDLRAPKTPVVVYKTK